MVKLLALIVLSLTVLNAHGQASSLYDIKVRSIDGEERKLADFKGKVLLIVNVASRCGFTSQYAGLQKLYAENRDKGFEVLGFPSNDFGGQEPGSESEIKAFCSNNYGVTFPMFSKVAVVGEAKHPLYKLLTSSVGGSEVGWNFEKFLISRDGRVLHRYSSSVAPADPSLIAGVKQALAGKYP